MRASALSAPKCRTSTGFPHRKPDRLVEDPGSGRSASDAGGARQASPLLWPGGPPPNPCRRGWSSAAVLLAARPRVRSVPSAGAPDCYGRRTPCGRPAPACVGPILQGRAVEGPRVEHAAGKGDLTRSRSGFCLTGAPPTPAAFAYATRAAPESGKSQRATGRIRGKPCGGFNSANPNSSGLHPHPWNLSGDAKEE